MESIILAGGLGTRLRSVIPELPKPMAPVAGRPFLWHLLSHLSKYNIHRVILSVGYKYELIQEYFGSRFGNIKIDYAVEEEPMGTGGGIRLALEKAKEDRIFIVNGDTFFAVDFNQLDAFHSSRLADLTMTLKPLRNFDRYGNVLTVNTRVIGFEEKRFASSGNINGGVYILNTQLFNQLDLGKKFSFETDFIEKYVSRLNFQAYISDTYFIDIGVPEDYQRAQSGFITMSHII